ncbi:MAG TPA: YebC/PmpR family DNA-binding transcriptional regulator [Patescibacteria group bacterium]|nr:YebC/PmpR family DNA-binding transcriptional regulator [Patescibacteria group bacterium]
MSGHSKWKTIKRQKGANDAKRGQAFTKLSMVITLAVKQGGGISDPEKNFRLRLAIDAARAINMPKDTIERAIERAAGKQVSEMEEVSYEGFGPGGISVMVEAITDNKQRTTPEIKSLFDKNGGTMGNPGSVAYQFSLTGQIILQNPTQSLDEIFLLAAECGADDVVEEDGEIIIYTKPEELDSVRRKLVEKNIALSTSEIIRKPLMDKVITDKEEADKAIAFLERLEDHQDVQKVYTNLHIYGE